jgi:YVTN family beta-propeller protein
VPISLNNSYRNIRVTATLVLFVLVLLFASCGQTYRPIATPVPLPGGDPQATHFALVVDAGTPPADGDVSQIDVSGDTNVGNRQVGLNPVHAVIGPSLIRAWVVNQGDSSVSSFSPSFTTIATVHINLEPNASPSFVDATSTFAFVTEPALNRIAILDANQTLVKAFVPVGANPVALAARPDGAKCYVANKGDSTVSVVSTQDNATIGNPIPVGAGPVALAMQTAGSFVYVVSQAGNSMSVINTSTDAEVQRINGLSAPFQVVWDNNLQRVYVVNGGANSISVFNASSPSNLTLLRTVSTASTPLGIGVLDNGTKFYVLYGGTPGSVGVFDAQSYALRTTLTVQNNPVSISAAPGSIKVYVANKNGDAGAGTPQFPNGSISIIKTQDDTLLTLPPGQPNPVFVTSQ